MARGGGAGQGRPPISENSRPVLQGERQRAKLTGRSYHRIAVPSLTRVNALHVVDVYQCRDMARSDSGGTHG